MHADVIVVGGGPAGSTAAREIAARGHSVLLIDRAVFPRDKPCGGGLSPRTVALLPFDLSPVIERVVTGVVIGDPRRGLATHDLPYPLLHMTQRRRLDAFLLDHARTAGVTVQEGWVVTGVQQTAPGAYRVDVEGEDDRAPGSHTCRVVVGADGASGEVGRAAALPRARTFGVALEGNLVPPGGIPAWLEHRVLIDVMVPGGYAWLFPKGDHVNIGVGGLQDAGPRLRDLLHTFTTSFGWDPDTLDELRGHQLPIHDPGMRVCTGGIALVGDAAALVEPLLGEGMYGAVASAVALAPVVARYLAGEVPDLQDYQRAVDRDLAPGIQRSEELAAILHRWPRPISWLLGHSALAMRLGAAFMYPESDVATPAVERAADALVPLLARIARGTATT